MKRFRTFVVAEHLKIVMSYTEGFPERTLQFNIQSTVLR